MRDDPELQINEDWADGSAYSPRKRRTRTGGSKFLQALLVIFLVLIITGSISYFLSKGPREDKASTLQSKVTALEQKIVNLQNQLTELQGKMSMLSRDPALLQRANAPAQKAEVPEKQKQPTVESKATSSPPIKEPVSIEKQYHTVQNGETLYRISNKYGLTVEELRKLNHLSADQPIRTGQKLLVAP